jgi:hypothetical protein
MSLKLPNVSEVRSALCDAVNENGDVPETRAYCEKVGIDYVVLKRVPKEGLPRRSSIDLRGY